MKANEAEAAELRACEMSKFFGLFSRETAFAVRY